MKKKIAILGSTGSIGKTLIKILVKDKKKFDVVLLTANKDYKTLLIQAKLFKVKNLIILNKKSYEILKFKSKNLKINIFNDFNNFEKIFKKKSDYVMSSITGIEGLKPTLDILKHTKKVAIANKEAIICGWNLLDKEIKKNKVEFIPVDSEHFSIWYGLKNNYDKISRVYLTASGGPFKNLSTKNFQKIKISDALKHPNWKMGQKISIDSATMMNKIFEIIEARKIFNIPYEKLSILIHPKSYIHGLIKFNNGIIKIIAHDTSMSIPIYNTLYQKCDKNISSNKINLNYLNNPILSKPNANKFPVIKLLNILPENESLFETVLVTANDELVKLFLNKEISFIDISKKLMKLTKLKKFRKYKLIIPKNIGDILKLNTYLRLKINFKSI